MIEIARERLAGARVQLEVGPAEALPIGDASFDLVLAFDSFDHWGDKSAGASEVWRVLAPGGRFVVVKDQGVPSLAADMVDVFATSGLTLEREDDLEGEGVAFKMWQLVKL